MDSTNRRQIPGGLIFFGWYEGAMAVYWPSPAAGAQRLAVLRLRPDAWLRSDQRARRGCGCVLAITRGLRHAAGGRRLRRGAWLRSDRRARRGCGRVLAITRGWRHAAHGRRLRRGAWLRSDQRATRGCGCVLAITRGSRPAAHG